MASSYTTNLRFTLPVQGELPASWGNTVNTGITSLVDSAISGTASIALTSTTYTLTLANGAADEARQMFLTFTGTPGGAATVTCPGGSGVGSKLYFVTNNTNVAVTLKTALGTGISVPAGIRIALYCDGTNVVEAVSGPSLSAITAASTSATLANGNNPIAWNWTQTTASQTGFAIGETTASTGGSGSQVLLKIGTVAASTADPLQVLTRGSDSMRVSRTGNINLTGISPAGAVAPIITLQGGISNLAQSGNSGGVVINGGAAGAVDFVAGGPIVLAAGAGSANANGGQGGAVTITAGNSGPSTGTSPFGKGGPVTITAGNGGSGGGGSLGNGGDMTIKAGNSGGGTAPGGTTYIYGGDATAATGTGGAVYVIGGSSFSTGNGGNAGLQSATVSGISGNALVTTGNSNSRGTGGITIQTGDPATNYNSGGISLATGYGLGTGTTGAISIASGNSQSSGTGVSGDITIQQGTSGATPTNGIRILGAAASTVASVAGGPITLTAGAGSTTTTGGLGGAVTITAGAGGLALAGGAATLKAGNGGASGAGGAVAITAGNGNSAAGGDITLTTGTGSTQGSVNFVNTNVANGSVATTLTSVGPTGAATTVQGWLAIKVGGTARYIPFW